MSSVQLWRRRKRGQVRSARKRGERAALPELGLPPRPSTAPDAVPQAVESTTSQGGPRPPSPETADAPESSRSYHSPFGVLSLKQAWDLSEIRARQSGDDDGSGGEGLEEWTRGGATDSSGGGIPRAAMPSPDGGRSHALLESTGTLASVDLEPPPTVARRHAARIGKRLRRGEQATARGQRVQ